AAARATTGSDAGDNRHGAGARARSGLRQGCFLGWPQAFRCRGRPAVCPFSARRHVSLAALALDRRKPAGRRRGFAPTRRSRAWPLICQPEMRHRRIRKVIVVNTADQGGGTERIAWLLFKGFEKRGIDSWMVVGQKRSDDPHVIPIYASP